MKRMRFLAPVLAAACLSFSTAASAQSVAFVDLERVVTESPQGRRLIAEIEAEQERLEAIAIQKQDEIQALRVQLANGASFLSPAEIAALQAQIEQKTRELQQFRDDSLRELNKLRDQRLKEIEPVIARAVNEVRTERGFGIIVQRNDVASADPALDISNAAIARAALLDR